MYAYDYSIFGRTLFTVSERTYNRLMTAYSWAGSIAVAVLIAAVFPGIPMYYAVGKTAQSQTAAPATPAPTATNPRANDVEPDRLIVYSSNPRFADGHIRIRTPFGITTAAISRYCSSSDRCHWQAVINDAWQLGLADGPYLITAYDANGDAVATWRLDRTGTEEVEVIQLYLLDNPREFRPMLRIGGVETPFEPLGRELYPTEPL